MSEAIAALAVVKASMKKDSSCHLQNLPLLWILKR